MERDSKLVVAVILNYNSIKDTKKCIHFLKRQDYNNLHIVVVDNHSSNLDEVELLTEFCNEYHIDIILSNKNGGFSAGNNIGIKRAIDLNAEWVLIINPDVEIRNTKYISHVLTTIDRWDQVGVVGTKVLLPDGSNQNPMRELTAIEEILFPIEIVKRKIGLGDNYKTKEITGYCEKVSGCCFFINVDFLKKNNLLDEHVFMYCEEPILAKSVVAQCYKTLYIDDVTAYHQHFKSDKVGSLKKKMITSLNSRKYYIRHYSGYGFITKNIAILAKNLEILIWKVKKDE